MEVIPYEVIEAVKIAERREKIRGFFGLKKRKVLCFPKEKVKVVRTYEDLLQEMDYFKYKEVVFILDKNSKLIPNWH